MAIAVIVCFVLLFVSYSKGQYDDCSTNRAVLERAFFETRRNLNELDRVFFPLRIKSSRFIIVNYTFLDAEGMADDGCRVTYIWVVGEALFFQQPKIFELTSLLFSNPATDLLTLSLQLPNKCRQLVNNLNTSCSCGNGSPPGSNPLDIFTQHLDEYAKYSSPSNVVRDNTIFSGRAICADMLAEEFYNGFKPKYHLYIIVTLLLPILLSISGYSLILKLKKKVKGKIQPKNHLNLVGLALTATYVLLYIFASDFAALVCYFTEDHDYKDFKVKPGRFNLIAIVITFATNTLLFFAQIVTIVVMVFKNRCWRRCKKVDNMYFLSLLLLFPSLSLTSHIGYILLAWLTAPSKATGVGFVSLGCVLFLFAIFRNTYESFLSCEKKLCSWLKCCPVGNKNQANKKFCCTSFILSVFFGIVPVLTLCSILAACFLIPLNTLPLADYLMTFCSAVIIFFSALAAYGLISLRKKSAFREFIEGFNEAYNDLDTTNEQTREEVDYNDAEDNGGDENNGAENNRDSERRRLTKSRPHDYGTINERPLSNMLHQRQGQAPVESLQTSVVAGRDVGTIAKVVYNKYKEN